MNIQRHKVTGFAVAVAVLGAVMFSSSILHNQPSAFATDPAPAATTVQAFDFTAFKKAYIKEGADPANDKKLEWAVSDSKKEVERIAATVAVLKTHLGETGQTIEATTPRATQMAILRDIAVYVKETETATKDAVLAKADASIAYHKATRKLIDIFVTRDDAAKNDTWALQDEADKKFVAVYAEIYKTDTGKEALKSFGADFATNAEKTGQLQTAIQNTFDKLKSGKSKTSAAILTALQAQLTEAVAYSGNGEASAEALATLTTGDAATAITSVTIPEASATNKLRLKVDTITNEHPSVTGVIKETDGTAAVAFTMNIINEAGDIVTPTKPVTIKLKLEGELKELFDNNKTIVLYHVTADKRNEKVEYTKKDDTITFSATSFSPYVFVAEKASAITPVPAATTPDAAAAPVVNNKDRKGSTGLADTGSVYIAPVIAGLAVAGLGIALLTRRS